MLYFSKHAGCISRAMGVCPFISEPVVVPKDFRLDRSRPLTSNTVHFIWEAVETSVDKIRGQFQGYRVICV